jgi:hypothetical protein
VVTSDVIRAHRHSSQHRDEVRASAQCGCFYCCAIFPPSEITEWIDEWEGVGQTAMCPRCGIDSVIGDESGYPVTPAFLREMKAHWFSAAT